MAGVPRTDSPVAAAPDAPPAPAPAPVLPKRKTRPGTVTKPMLLPPHGVILHNDPINGMDYVVGVLKKVFCYRTLRCIRLMLVAHFRGRVIVWTGSLEVAELKAEQLRSAGPDPRAMSRGAKRLTVTAEKLP